MRSLKAAVLLALCACAACSPSTAAPPALVPQVHTASAVTVKVTPRDVSGPAWEFEIVFDTHSRDLDDDLLKDTVLVAADGSEIRPLDWRGPPPGGHHRSGVLRFPPPQPVPDPLVLRIRRAGEAEPRTFWWKMR